VHGRQPDHVHTKSPPTYSQLFARDTTAERRVPGLTPITAPMPAAFGGASKQIRRGVLDEPIHDRHGHFPAFGGYSKTEIGKIRTETARRNSRFSTRKSAKLGARGRAQAI
jgi:hypothetical protein